MYGNLHVIHVRKVSLHVLSQLRMGHEKTRDWLSLEKVASSFCTFPSQRAKCSVCWELSPGDLVVSVPVEVLQPRPQR